MVVASERILILELVVAIMALENLIKQKLKIIAATLTLSSLLIIPATSHAAIDRNGNVRSVNGTNSCAYKNHRLVISYDFVNGRESAFVYRVYNTKGQKIDIETLHPSRLIEYNPNTEICEDIDEPKDPKFLCC